MSTLGKPIKVLKDCPARLIPSAEQVMIPKSMVVNTHLILGGNLTIAYNGNLYRISEKHLSCLDTSSIIQELQKEQKIEFTDSIISVNEHDIWKVLSTCYDPEIPVNIVELGLVYKCILTRLSDNSYEVTIDMTLTSPSCGMGPIIVDEVQDKIMSVPGVDHASINLVFDPAWSHEMVSEVAKIELGII